MKQHRSGFTVVELIVVVVVLAIIAAIVGITWTAVTANTRDNARASDIKQWVSTFDLYKGRFAVWPVLPVSDVTATQVCLGMPLSPNNRCVQYNGSSSQFLSTSDANFIALQTEVQKVGDFPKNKSEISKNIAVGPFVHVEQETAPDGTITVTGKFVGFFENNCPKGFENVRDDSDFTTLFSGLPDKGTAPHPCMISPAPSFSYKPTP